MLKTPNDGVSKKIVVKDLTIHWRICPVEIEWFRVTRIEATVSKQTSHKVRLERTGN